MRLDKTGAHRTAFDKNKQRLLKTQNYCGICGKQVDKSIKYPDPLSPVIDHIIPVAVNVNIKMYKSDKIKMYNYSKLT